MHILEYHLSVEGSESIAATIRRNLKNIILSERSQYRETMRCPEQGNFTEHALAWG